MIKDFGIKLFPLLLLLLSPCRGVSQTVQIMVDGKFDEWGVVSLFREDPEGDQVSGDIDFTELKVTNDQDNLYILLKVGTKINLQDLNRISIYIDGDNDPRTGLGVERIGAEIKYTFGLRKGIAYTKGGEVTISHTDIGLVSMPTVTSNEFEISIARNNEINLFSSDTICIAFKDEDTGQDQFPDFGVYSLVYTFASFFPEPLSRISLKPSPDNHLRMVSYNVLRNGFHRPDRSESFSRIFNALQADIYGFQEIYDYSAEETLLKFKSLIADTADGDWYASKVDPDIIMVSRHHIKASYRIEGNGAFIVDMNPMFDSDILVIVAHLPCCANNTGRQREIDAIMGFIRDAKLPGGFLTLAPDTPILIMGDMNLVGYDQQLRTLTHGDIVDQVMYGAAFNPDWDGSDLRDLLPRHTNSNMFFTWYDQNSSFSPGRLDFMIYTDSVIEALSQFILFTPDMNPDTLTRYGLHPDDTVLASDHLPVIGDYQLRDPATANSPVARVPDDHILIYSYPNPFNGYADIWVETQVKSEVLLEIFDIVGRRVTTLYEGFISPGRQHFSWHVDNELSSGTYIVQLKTNHILLNHKLQLIK